MKYQMNVTIPQGTVSSIKGFLNWTSQKFRHIRLILGISESKESSKVFLYLDNASEQEMSIIANSFVSRVQKKSEKSILPITTFVCEEVEDIDDFKDIVKQSHEAEVSPMFLQRNFTN